MKPEKSAGWGGGLGQAEAKVGGGSPWDNRGHPWETQRLHLESEGAAWDAPILVGMGWMGSGSETHSQGEDWGSNRKGEGPGGGVGPT